MLHRSIPKSALVVLVAGFVPACQSPRPPDSAPPPLGGMTSGGSTGAPSPVGSSSEDTGVLLDLGDADVPSTECASVAQSTEAQELPSDVIIIVDPEADRKAVQDAVSNLSPELEHNGIFDTRVILIAGPAPTQPECDIFACCDSWTCWNPKSVPDHRFFEILESEVDPNTVLTDLLDSADEWGPLLREESWKHVWVNTSRGADTTTSGPDFAAAFAALGPSYASFVFHVLLSGGFVDDDYVQLARDTAGVHFPLEGGGGEIYRDFVLEIQEQLRTTPLSCAYAIPDPPMGQTFARDHINVEYDIGLGPNVLGYVDSVDACADFGQGWFYDDVADPQEILICPQSCGAFRSQEVASIEIQFGCATIPAG